jgi:hypothetical protein
VTAATSTAGREAPVTGGPADRWQLWRRVFDHGLMPPLGRLRAEHRARAASAERVWAEVLAPEVTELVASGAALPPGAGVRRVAGFAYDVSRALGALHGIADGDAHETGAIGVWMALAAAEMDRLVDDGEVAPAAFREHLAADRVEQVLRPGAAVQDTPCVPDQPYLRRCLDRAFDGLRRRMFRPSADPFRDDVNREIVTCVRSMLEGQLDSPDLRMRPDADLGGVEETLRRVNALTVWMVTYVGLLHRPRPDGAVLASLRRAATAVGQIGWILDALSDIHEDLDAGVWSLVWLELARESGPGAAWLRAGDPAASMRALSAAGAIDRLLARLARLIDSIEGDPALPAAPRHALGGLCRWMVWAFLAAPEPT